MDRLKERIQTARKALMTLEELAGKDKASNVERDAAIQRFEYTVEAAWKAVQLYLREHEGIDLGAPKAVIRTSLQVGLLDDGNARLALQMIDDRNLTAHTYNDALAVAIYKRSGEYARMMNE